jgi:hypothetical protein
LRELAVFACDFGLLQPRAGLPSLYSVARRQLHLCGSAGDALHRQRLREAMLAQRLLASQVVVLLAPQV